ncbi:MAG TPA: YraN family protein [Firmicutes bacterium]|nr:YraN family protein [Bacillota bacterium]
MNPGKKGEELACRYLQQRGLVVLERNFRLRRGEIDLIMAHGPVLVFVEVKYRSSQRYGTALESVTKTKQRRIKLVAAAYLQRFTDLPDVRFDVVGVAPSGQGHQFTWVKGAFE